MDTGVIDGVLHHPSFMLNAGVGELVESAVNFGDEGLWRAMTAAVINKDTFDKLPEDLQAIITEYTFELMLACFGKDAEIREMVLGPMTNRGVNFIQLSDAQFASLKPFGEGVHKKVITELEGKGIPGQAIFDRLHELAAA